MEFTEVLKIILQKEGGYVNDPNDPGGETNYGIADARDGVLDGMTDVDGDGIPETLIRKLTPAQAGEIYKRDYWRRIRGDSLPGVLRLIMMDGGVNQGVNWMSRMLQKHVGVVQDGNIGPKTLAAVNKLSAKQHYDLFVVLAKERDARYRINRNFNRYGKGWLNRLDSVVKYTTKWLSSLKP